MKPLICFRPLAAVVAAVVTLLLLVNAAYAHEEREVGEYVLTVGWMVEPAFEAQKNGISLRIERHVEEHVEGEEGEASAASAESEAEEAHEPVEGQEGNLQVEVTHVPTGVSRVMSLRRVFGDPGHYTADLIPTAPGQYRFRFFGTIEEMAVDEVFESGEETFDGIEPVTEAQFPEPLPAAREIEGAVRGAQQVAQQAADAASSAQTLAIIGLTIGLIGMTFGLVSLVSLRRR